MCFTGSLGFWAWYGFAEVVWGFFLHVLFFSQVSLRIFLKGLGVLVLGRCGRFWLCMVWVLGDERAFRVIFNRALGIFVAKWFGFVDCFDYCLVLPCFSKGCFLQGIVLWLLWGMISWVC